MCMCVLEKAGRGWAGGWMGGWIWQREEEGGREGGGGGVRGSTQAAGESPESLSCIIGEDPLNLSSTGWLR